MDGQRRRGKVPAKEYGEGNYVASRKYQEEATRFAASGKVEEAARAAETQSDADALQLAAAEAEGKRRAKEEDPALNRGSPPAPGVKPPMARDTPRPGGPGDE